MLATKLLEQIALKENKTLVLNFREWFAKEYPELQMAVFISTPLEMQLGIWLMFFQENNYYVLVTPNSYAIDFVKYDKDQATLTTALQKIKDQDNPYLIQEYDMKLDNILLVYEKAIIDMIKLLNGGLPF